MKNRYSAFMALAALMALGASCTQAHSNGSSDEGPPIIAVSITGLPSGADAAVTVKGPGSYSSVVDKNTDLESLAAGNYELWAAVVTSGGQKYFPRNNHAAVAFDGSSKCSVNIDYARRHSLLTVAVATENGSSSMDFALIGGANFDMGSIYQYEATPVHAVSLDDYYVSITECTQLMYKAVTGADPSYFRNDSCPVETVYWDDVAGANGFYAKLNAALPGYGFRLPSESEWEYAARGGTMSDFYWDSSDSADYGWFSANAGGVSHPVGQKIANAYGLYDMFGNVWEWCADYYHGSYEGAPVLGEAWTSNPDVYNNRIYRGGNWASAPSQVWKRNGYNDGNNGGGFRHAFSP